MFGINKGTGRRAALPKVALHSKKIRQIVLMEDEETRLLDILEAHGRQFLNAFDLTEPPLKRQRTEESFDQEDEEFEEWRGFGDTGIESYSFEGNNGDEDDGLWLSRWFFRLL